MYLVKTRPGEDSQVQDITTHYVSLYSRDMTSSDSWGTLLGRNLRLPSDTFYSVEKASCGIAMEIAKADSKTDWEKMMLHINESIRLINVLHLKSLLGDIN